MSESEGTMQRLKYLVTSIRNATDELVRIVPGVLSVDVDLLLTGRLSIQVSGETFRDFLAVECVRKTQGPKYPLEISCTIGPAKFFAVVNKAELSSIPVPGSALMEAGILNTGMEVNKDDR